MAVSSPWFIGRAETDHVEMQLGLRPEGHFIVVQASGTPDALRLAYRCCDVTNMH